MSIQPPFFEFGPKAFLYGEEMLRMALWADELSVKYDVDIIITPQYMDIPILAKQTKHIHVFAQHMDGIPIGRGIGTVLPESLVAAGAEGVLLNHCERRLTLYELENAVRRAHEVGLSTIVCADNERQGAMIAHLHPDIIIAESPALVGGGQRTEDDASIIESINQEIWAVDPNIKILQGAGITNENDVYSIILAGAQAAGSTSGIIKADNPKRMFEKMICSLRKAWNEANSYAQVENKKHEEGITK